MFKNNQNRTKEDILYHQFLKTGDKNSFNELFRVTKPWLLKIIYKIVLDYSLAHDILQDTWIKVLQNQSKFDKSKKITNYLYTIAKNESLKYIRDNKNITIYYSDCELNMLQNGSSSDPVTIQLNAEKIKTLRSALKKLNTPYQDVVYLYYYAELGIKDIAEILDKPDGTIKTWLYRAREQLRIYLGLYFKN